MKIRDADLGGRGLRQGCSGLCSRPESRDLGLLPRPCPIELPQLRHHLILQESHPALKRLQAYAHFKAVEARSRKQEAASSIAMAAAPLADGQGRGSGLHSSPWGS